jgi:MFS transporter, DHA1 family, inner membrane transport protein
MVGGDSASIMSRRSENLLLFAVIVMMTVNGTAIVIVAPLAVDIALAFDTSVSVVGQLRSVAALVAGTLAPFVGVMSDRLGRRPVMFAGLLAIAGFGLGSALAPSFAVLLAVHAISGFGIAALLASGFALAGDAFPAERRARAVGIISVGPAMAWVVGLPLIGLTGDLFGWRMSFIVIPALFSLVGMLMLRWIPAGGGSPGQADFSPFESISTVLRIASARAWILAELMAYTGWAGTLVYLGAYYITEHDQSVAATGLLMALTALTFVGGSLISHVFSVRFGPRRTIIGTASISASLLIITFVARPQIEVSLGLLMLFGVSQGVRGAAASVLGMMQLTSRHGMMMGFRAAVTQYGYLFGGLIGGVLLATGGFALLGTVFAMILVTAGLITLTTVREAPPPGTRAPGR